LAATLGKLPENSTESAKESPKAANSWGFSVQPLTSDLASKFGYAADSGVVINEVTPNSPASEAGLEPGMLIQQVNRQKVKSTEEFTDAMQKDKDAKSVMLLVANGQGSRFVVLKVSE
jgi:serine protease Do